MPRTSAPTAAATAAGPLEAARAQALAQIIRAVALASLVIVIGFAINALANGAWHVPQLYAVVLAASVFLDVVPRLSFRWRGALFVLVLYAAGALGGVTLGLGATASLFLVGFAVVAAALFGWRAGAAATAISLATWLALIAAATLGGPPLSAADPDALVLDWLSAGASMLLISIALMLPQRLLTARPQAYAAAQQLAELAEARARLASQSAALEKASQEALLANQQLEAQAGQHQRRAALLALSAEVAQASSDVRDLDELLNLAVRLIADRFEYYHAGLFLLDAAGEWALLRAASSPGGQAMLARGHRLRVGQEGIVGFVTGRNEARLALDVGADAVHFANPDLPDTHSEVAVPIHARGALLGALDVQSTETNAFTPEDVSVLQTLADQLGVAIDNARLLQETQQRLADLRSLQQLGRDSSLAPAAAEPLAFRYDGIDVRPLDQPAGAPPGDEVLVVPLQFGDQDLGVLELRREGEAWTSEDLELTAALAERMALALESAQLFENTRARAQQLAELSEASLEFSGPQFSTAQVLDGITRAALRLFGVDTAALWLPAGGGGLELRAARTAAGPAPGGARVDREQGLAGRVFATGRAQRAQAAGEADPSRPSPNALAAPMLWQGQRLGVLVLGRAADDRPFTPEDENVALLFAAQAASTLENARLFAETQQRLSELATINAISQALSTQLDRQALAETVGEKVSAAFGHDAFVALYDAATGLIEMPYFTSDDGQREAIPPFPLGAGLTSHVIRTRQPLLINRDTAARVAELGALQQGRPARSWLGVPILLGGEPLGVLSVQDLEHEGVFDDDDLRLLTTIASNAGVAMQNVRLFEQTQQRAEELAVVNELARAISEQLEPTQVLQTVYEQIQRITPLDGFFVTLYDHKTGLQTTPLIYEAGRRSEEGPRPLPARGLLRQVVDTGQVVLINRTPEQVEAVALSPEHAMSHASQVAASLLYLPLHFGQQVGGVMSVQSLAYNAYSQRQVDVLTAVANHVVVALQNARLFEETERRAEQLATAGEVARATISVLSPDELIVQAVELIRDRFERSAGVYYAALFLVDEAGQWARLRHATGNAGRVLLDRQHKLEVGGNSMVGWATANRRARIALDVGAEPVRFANPLLPNTRSELALPLTVGQTVLGALDVQSTKSSAFTEADVAVLQTMADQIAVALQNARLFERTARQARRERLVVDITSKIRATNDMDSMLRTAVEELRLALGTSRAAIRLQPAGRAVPAGLAAGSGAESEPLQAPANGDEHGSGAAEAERRPADDDGPGQAGHGTNGARRNGRHGAHGAGG